MNYSANSQLILIDPRDFVTEALKKTLCRKPWFREIHLASSTESALKCVLDRSLKPSFHLGALKTLVLIGGKSYWKVMSILRRIEVCLPNARIILLDDRPKFGCMFVADRHTLHGCVSLLDSLDFCCDCVDRVAHGQAALTPETAMFLEIDPHRNVLKGRKKSRSDGPAALTEKEWCCFRQLVAGRDMKELVEKLELKPRSVRNLQYRVMDKLGVRKQVDLVRLAGQWGFLEE